MFVACQWIPKRGPGIIPDPPVKYQSESSISTGNFLLIAVNRRIRPKGRPGKPEMGVAQNGFKLGSGQLTIDGPAKDVPFTAGLVISDYAITKTEG